MHTGLMASVLVTALIAGASFANPPCTGSPQQCSEVAKPGSTQTKAVKPATPPGQARGGVRVATGDLNGDGVAAKGATDAPKKLAQKEPSPVPLPAVQKVRDATSR